MNRDDVMRMAKEACGEPAWNGGVEWVWGELERFAKLVAEAEREACAKVLDEMAENDKLSNYYRVAALAIRERGAP